MDVSRFRLGDWMLVAGGAAMLVLGLAVPWVTVTVRGTSLPGARNAFDYPLTGGIAWLLVVAAGVVTFLRAAGLLRDGNVPWTRIVAAGSALAVILLALRLVLGPGDYSGAELGRGAGMTISFLAAAVASGGAMANHRAEGGRFGDLWPFGGRTGRAAAGRPAAAVSDDLPPPA